MSNIVKALLIINAKKGWSEAARRKAALTRKRKSSPKKAGSGVNSKVKGLLENPTIKNLYSESGLKHLQTLSPTMQLKILKSDLKNHKEAVEYYGGEDNYKKAMRKELNQTLRQG